ncbi:cytochrome c4 [Glaciimonas sp. PCH181]|uniref:c-type cytochrome n=1 Tax=Glaciimonas sp. PCH181 TaxID=2133943 RepID=UPI001CEDA425|nr:cytochrome c4 [Glaciimonas sp. PCH181]
MKTKPIDSRQCTSLATTLHAGFCLLKACGTGGLLWLSVISGNAIAQNVLPDTIAQRVVACIACHGKEGRAASDGFYPRIAGKPAGYLYNQLINFREGRRKYPLMIYTVDHLSDAYLREMAEYFSAQHPPYPAPQPVTASAAVLERGRILVQSGDVSKNVPACIACHGKSLTGIAPSIPGLVGLPHDYMSAQFGAWKNGTRHAAAPDCMAQISERLTVEDISAALAWLTAQPIPAQTAAASAPSQKLPLACGSLPQQ